VNDLTKLAIKYKTDKYGKHHYTDVYYDIFKHRRKNIVSVLEIGVSQGMSLRMWRDFFPNAMIYGIDNKDDYIFYEDRIKVFQCDQRSGDQLKDLISKIGKHLDLVVDDGSHNPDDQVYTCNLITSLLKRDFIYVIEDVADASIIGKLNKKFDISMIRVGKRYDDRLIILGNLHHG
jgi:hypothetical protein